MPYELMVAHCPECGKVFQKNSRNLCADCAVLLDKQMSAVERFLLHNRFATTEELADATELTPNKIRTWIRKGKLSILNYPNLADRCDLCLAPIRRGHLCVPCSMRINEDIQRTLERDRVSKERLRSAHSYIHKN